jgi:hypothetical protein
MCCYGRREDKAETRAKLEAKYCRYGDVEGLVGMERNIDPGRIEEVGSEPV